MEKIPSSQSGLVSRSLWVQGSEASLARGPQFQVDVLLDKISTMTKLDIDLDNVRWRLDTCFAFLANLGFLAMCLDSPDSSNGSTQCSQYFP